MFVVRFVRRDRQPAEEYYYNTIEEARWHLGLFRDDDSELYKRIELSERGNPENIIEKFEFIY